MNDLSIRKWLILGFVAVVLSLYSVRLFYLQVLNPQYRKHAQQNVIKRVTVYPARGVLYDRKGRLYVVNHPEFSIEVIPKLLKIKDTVAFARLLDLSVEQLKELLQKAKSYSMEKPSPLVRYIDQNRFHKIQEFLWQYDGLRIKPQMVRRYYYPYGAHFLGYINEVNKEELKHSSYYRQGDLIGRTGIERSYERLLRGKKGVRMILEDVLGREMGSYAQGKYDSAAVMGSTLYLTIDVELQGFAERLMQNKRGAIVAIEPKTGEILACVSAPSYDPNLLSGRAFSKHWKQLKNDKINKPLFSRAYQATYPPGSVFKLLNALIALQEGTHRISSVYRCVGGFPRGPGNRPKCHEHPSPLNMIGAIQYSCNAYFAALFYDFMKHPKFKNHYEAYEVWYRYMKQFGVGRRLGVDIPNESAGFLPTARYYDRHYGKWAWSPMTIISNAIGQGEILMTPLQMANVAAMIANKGYYIVPHFVKAVRGEDRKIKPLKFDTFKVAIDTMYFNRIIQAMELAVRAGTGYWGRVQGIRVAGKTGTAQNPHGKDHSVFIAFAPVEDPKIAVAVVVENAGFGGTWAAPIASLIIEKYLKGTIQNQWQLQRILNANFYVAENHQQRSTIRQN